VDVIVRAVRMTGNARLRTLTATRKTPPG